MERLRQYRRHHDAQDEVNSRRVKADIIAHISAWVHIESGVPTRPQHTYINPVYVRDWKIVLPLDGLSEGDIADIHKYLGGLEDACRYQVWTDFEKNHLVLCHSDIYHENMKRARTYSINPLAIGDENISQSVRDHIAEIYGAMEGVPGFDIARRLFTLEQVIAAAQNADQGTDGIAPQINSIRQTLASIQGAVDQLRSTLSR